MSVLEIGDQLNNESKWVESKYDKDASTPNRWNADSGSPPESDVSTLREMMEVSKEVSKELEEEIERRTVDVLDGYKPEGDLDEDDFFTQKVDEEEVPTVATRYDLEKAVSIRKKTHFVEKERYWVNEPYAFISIFQSKRDNEHKYYIIEPYKNTIEDNIIEFFERKLKSAIKYEQKESIVGSNEQRKGILQDKARTLMDRYDLFDMKKFDTGNEESSLVDTLRQMVGRGESIDMLSHRHLEGTTRRQEHVVLDENSNKLSPHQVQKSIYYLTRNFIGYERIDSIKYDINVEDISCNGYNEPVFVYHGEHEQIITNVSHGRNQLDDFVVKLAQRSGKGISKRDPQVDATLPDGSRAQLTLGSEVSDKGTNYTIRQFKDIPFTPVDLINWRTFGLEEMGFLWLAIENNKSMIFAGGTASGKTTSLNAVSLFIPSSEKVVSIEDTREVELPQRNWIASVTRPSFSGEKGDVDEFALLEAALRQRPDYIVMGEVRGEEGRTLFQVMSTGHTTYTTFHADSVGEVLKRFTTDPINVSKTLFTALDLVSMQTATRVDGKKVRRNENITEINSYDAENDEVNVQDVYEWIPDEDEFRGLGREGTVRGTETFENIIFDRGWSDEEAWDELRKRRMVLAYLIINDINKYKQVAATIQAFINDQETVLTLIANGALEERLEELRDMESILIDVDDADEERVPRPDPDEAMEEKCRQILKDTKDLIEPYKDRDPEKALIESSLPDEADVQERTIQDELEEVQEEGELERLEQIEREAEEFNSEEQPPEDDFEPVDDGD